MNRSPLTAQVRSVVPPDQAEVAVASVGWRRVGFLQRLVKVDVDAESLAADTSNAFRSERSQRRAA